MHDSTRLTNFDFTDWSWGRKLYTSVFLSIGCGMMAGTHNFVNPANNLMAKLLKTNVSTVSQSVSVILLTLGLSAVLSSPAARIWGKRPIILLGNSIAILGYIIVIARSDSIVALFVGRGIHGLGIAQLEYLVSSSVGDLFFVHERGFHLALWHYSLSGGNSIGQVIGTQIVAAQGWTWPFVYAYVVSRLWRTLWADKLTCALELSPMAFTPSSSSSRAQKRHTSDLVSSI
jgi:MFS family permease